MESGEQLRLNISLIKNLILKKLSQGTALQSFPLNPSIFYDLLDNFNLLIQSKYFSDGAHEIMLANGRKPKVVSKEVKTQEEYEALQNFLRSISSTATLPPYVKGESYSSCRGVFNQVI